MTEETKKKSIIIAFVSKFVNILFEFVYRFSFNNIVNIFYNYFKIQLSVCSLSLLVSFKVFCFIKNAANCFVSFKSNFEVVIVFNALHQCPFVP